MKNKQEAFERTRGIFNITVTPFDSEGNLNKLGLKENINRVLDMGYDGLLIGGTYGEFPTMDTEERGELFRLVMDVVGDRVPVLLCTTHSDPRVVKELTVLASDLGGLPMITAPYVSEITEDQIFTYFEDIAPLSKTGIMVYNAPGIGITLSPALIERLAEIENVVALKQGDLNPTTVDILASRLAGKIRILAASDLVFLGPIATGFDGFSSTNSGALPEVILESYRSISKGDAGRAAELHRAWAPLRELARAFGQPQTTKAIMNLRGWQGGSVRQPLRDINPVQLEQLKQVLGEVGENSAAMID